MLLNLLYNTIHTTQQFRSNTLVVVTDIKNDSIKQSIPIQAN